MLSKWGKLVDEKEPWNEYPRMQMQRDSYHNLNGAWEYQITERKQNPEPGQWKKIIVPFALGSELSQATEQLGKGKALWYRKQFSYKPNAMHTYIHFEAVDMECMVFMNGLEVGSHKGGYTPFSFDVSEYVKYQNSLMIRCIDDSNYGKYAYGKQKIENGGMWYTPTAGVWGSVWMEDIAEHGIHDLKITPDVDQSCVHISLAGNFSQALITVATKGHVVFSGITDDKTYTIPLKQPHLWSVNDPFLYDLYVQTEDDVIRSYFGMRKFSLENDRNGIVRFCLNNKPLFLTGLLDQGYNSDGMYTFPSEEALVYELQKVKDMGFNMLRKHAKIEPRRWYYECDRLGILVMQDMPSGGFVDQDKLTTMILPNLGFTKMKDTKNHTFVRSGEESQQIYYEELDEMLDSLYNATCIFSWVPFNEGWGQFSSKEVTKHIKAYDTTRLVDSASGWHDNGAGDFQSVHNYFFPYHTKKDKYHRACILSEFGGYSYLEKGHHYVDKMYGYKKYQDKLQLMNGILKLYEDKIIRNIPKGLTGCIYTQLSDVQDECNGIFTFDREVIKVDERKMKKINERCIRRMSK